METETKIRRPRIDNQTFVKVWMKVHAEGGNQSAVAEELGCTPAGVNGKYKRFIKDGVNLPPLTGGRSRKVDVDALNALIENLSS